MKKITQKVVSAGLSVALLAGTVQLFAACGKTISLDNERDALVFASQQFDGVFNPFFSTSAYDSEVVGQTQIGMMTIDDGGNLAYGKNYPVVTLDYFSQTYDASGQVSAEGSDDGTTVYQFVIKKGIKFSDGVDLTIKDVLFSLYVYLDPIYTGSSTIYSTDIQGLKKYRTQDLNANDDSTEGFEENFMVLGRERKQRLAAYLDNQPYEEKYKDEILTDLARAKELFKEELGRDYINAENSIEDYKKEYPFESDEIWKLFLYTEGVTSLERNSNGIGYKKVNGKYVIDPVTEDAYDMLLAEAAGSKPTQQECIDFVYDYYASSNKKMLEVVSYWGTSSELLTEFVAKAKSDYFDDLREKNDGNLAVPSISGIRALKGSEFKGTQTYDNSYDVLQITINGVDPKAVWNFSYSVVPMHYYSTADEIAKADCVNNFGVKASDSDFFDQLRDKGSVPVGAGAYMASSLNGSATQNKNYSYLSAHFFEDGWVYFERNPYFYTTLGDGTDTSNNARIKYMRYKVIPKANTLQALYTGEVHYAVPDATQTQIEFIEKRSDTIAYSLQETNGYGYIGINAKFIKDLNVRRAIMTTMNASLVKVYYPGNLSKLIYRPMSLTSWVYDADAAGEGNLLHYDPVSLQGNKDESYYGYDETFTLGAAYMNAAGYTKGSDGKWYNSSNQTLESVLREKSNINSIVFTVPVDTNDHPAYRTLANAVAILNRNGISASLKTDANALSKLSNGELTSWAAAWSSTIDPDMFQVYHKNSQASSVKNWGYDWLVTQNGASSEEALIINDLSDLIDQGRETLNRSLRKTIYRQALDKVMELAVELPLYQRNDMFAYNVKYIDRDTLYPNPTTYYGIMAELWKVSLKVN